MSKRTIYVVVTTDPLENGQFCKLEAAYEHRVRAEAHAARKVDPEGEELRYLVCAVSLEVSR